MDDVLGSLAVQITGDLSSLQSAIDSGVAIAETGAAKIAQEFNLPDMAAPMVASAQEGATALSELGDAAVEAGTQMGSATGDVTDFGEAASGAGSSASGAAPGVTELGDAAEETGGKMEGLGESLTSIAELVGVGLGIAEAVDSLKELAVESIDAAGKIQMTEVALTTFTGSAETAKSILDDLKSLAAQSIFSFPDLASAAQKMAALGVAAADIPAALYAAAASAEATGNSLDTVTNALDRVYLTGTLSTRQLATLGISMQDLATVMGVGADQVKEKFKELGSGSEESLNILTTTITNKVGPAFQSMQDTVPVAINRVKVAWDSMLEAFGKAVAPDVSALLGAIQSLIEPTGAVVTELTQLSLENFGPIINSAHDLASIVIELGKDAGVAGASFAGIDWSTFASDVVNFATHLRDARAALDLMDTGVQILTNHFPDMDAAVSHSVQNLVTGTEALTQAQVASRLATEQHLLALKNLADGAGNAEAATAKLVATVTKEETTLADAKAALKDIETNYQGSSDYAQLHEKAVQAVDAAYKALNPTLKTHKDTLDAVDTSAQKITQDYLTASATWLKVKEAFDNGTASLVQLGIATENSDKAAAAYSKTIQAAGQDTKATATEAGNLATIIENGKEVLVPYAGAVADAAKATQDLTQATSDEYQAFQDAGGAAADDTSAIIQLRGATDGAKQSTDDLSASWVYTNGVWEHAIDLINQVNNALDTQAASATAAADALQSEADALDSVSSASTKASGGKGGGQSASSVSLEAMGYGNPYGTSGASNYITGNAPGSGGTVGGPGGVGLLASGGIATQGNAYIVGENGPEMFIPETTGTVLPAGTFEMVDSSSAGTATPASSMQGFGDIARPGSNPLVNAGFVNANQSSPLSYTISINGQQLPVDGATYDQFMASLKGSTATVASVAATGQDLYNQLTASAGIPVSDMSQFATVTINGQTVLTDANTAAQVNEGAAAGLNSSALQKILGGANVNNFLESGQSMGVVTPVLQPTGGYDVVTIGGQSQLVFHNTALAIQQAAAAGANDAALENMLNGTYSPLASTAGTAFVPLTPSGLPPAAPPLNPGTGGFGLGEGPNGGVTINFAGATIYGTQGAQAVAQQIVNTLKTSAGQLRY